MVARVVGERDKRGGVQQDPVPETTSARAKQRHANLAFTGPAGSAAAMGALYPRWRYQHALLERRAGVAAPERPRGRVEAGRADNIFHKNTTPVLRFYMPCTASASPSMWPPSRLPFSPLC